MFPHFRLRRKLSCEPFWSTILCHSRLTIQSRLAVRKKSPRASDSWLWKSTFLRDQQLALRIFNESCAILHKPWTKPKEFSRGRWAELTSAETCQKVRENSPRNPCRTWRLSKFSVNDEKNSALNWLKSTAFRKIQREKQLFWVLLWLSTIHKPFAKPEHKLNFMTKADTPFICLKN